MVYLIPSAEVQRLIGNVIQSNVIQAKYTILKQEPFTVTSKLILLLLIIMIFKNEQGTVTNNEIHAVFSDMTVQTDRHIRAKRHVIIIKDNVKSTCKLIDITVPCDNKNSSSQEIEKKK